MDAPGGYNIVDEMLIMCTAYFTHSVHLSNLCTNTCQPQQCLVFGISFLRVTAGYI